jgi:hypothetical protein
MKRVFAALGLFLVSAFLSLSVWGYYYGDHKNGKKISIGTCIKGVQGTMTFGDNKTFSYVHHAWGPAIFKMETWIVGTPGSVFGFITGPICPNDDVEAYAERWHLEHPNTDVDTGLPLPPTDNDDGEPQEGATPSKKG